MPVRSAARWPSISHTPSPNASFDRNITSRLRDYRYDEAFLRQIEPPTMYLWVAADPFGGVEIEEQCAAAQPNAVLKTFPDSGHLPWLDDPETQAWLVSSFLFD